MPSNPRKHEEKYSLLTNESGRICFEETASEGSLANPESGTIKSKRYPIWRSFTAVWNLWYLCIPLALVILALFSLLLFPSCKQCQSLDMSGYVCAPNGALPKIARDRGCEFDTMSFKWWPKEPMMHKENMALLKDFHDEGPWHRYYDKGGKHEIPPTSEVLTAGWVSRKEHTYHCMYTLRQTHLWMTLGYDAPFNYTHTVHCTKYLMDTILENPPKDFEELSVHGTPWPEHPDIVGARYLIDSLEGYLFLFQ